MKLKGYTLLQSKLRTIRAALEAVEAEEEILDEVREEHATLTEVEEEEDWGMVHVTLRRAVEHIARDPLHR